MWMQLTLEHMLTITLPVPDGFPLISHRHIFLSTGSEHDRISNN